MYNKRRESIGRFRTSNFYRIRLSAPDSPVPGEGRSPNSMPDEEHCFA